MITVAGGAQDVKQPAMYLNETWLLISSGGLVGLNLLIGFNTQPIDVLGDEGKGGSWGDLMPDGRERECREGDMGRIWLSFQSARRKWMRYGADDLKMKNADASLR